MKLDKGMLGMAAGISLFVGFVIVAVAIGAIVPSMHKLTAPLICRGDVEVETIKYSYKPGQVGWQHYIYCVNEQTGEKKEITFPAIGVTGLVASAVIFAIIAYRMRSIIFFSQDSDPHAADLKPKPVKTNGRKKKKEGRALERLSELKKMRDQNLISAAEYERKKTEIMDEL